MLQRPLYQGAIAILTLAALAGGLWLLVAPDGPPGVAVTRTERRADTEPPPTQATIDSRRIDINSATAEEMDAALPDIGPVLANRIVEFREANGRFVRADQLLAVRGIGPLTFDRIGPLVTVGD